MKKIVAILLAGLMVVPAVFAKKIDKSIPVGVSMPTKDLQRWNQDGANMKAKLEEAGYKVDLQYANNDVATQISQIENMLTKGDKVLVIAPIDGSSLTNVLKTAKKKKVQVISYDRLIMNSDAVSYYATFDNYKVGTFQANFLIEKLGLKTRTASNPVTMEFFAGDPGDNNAGFFFNGAYDALKPYIDKGVIIVPSGQKSFAQVATLMWSSETAQSRMENLIAAQGYGPKGKKLDAVCASNDSTALGVVNALVGANYTADNIPIVTGQDCDIANVKNMLKGLQAMSIFKDTRTLADKVVGMVDAIMQGKKPPVNDTTTYNNNSLNQKDPKSYVKSYLCEPVVGTTDNYKALLIDSGYYKESELR
jgi:putative multiple sugar transport system substrate-binding protein